MTKPRVAPLPPYPQSLAGILLGAREAVMAPIRPLLRQANVTEQQWRVLRVLADAGSLDASGIADQAMLYPPSVTRIMKEFLDRGLIMRTVDPADARRSVISITQDGLHLVQETAKHTRALLDGYEKAFGQKRLTTLMAEAAALTQALDPFQPPE